MERGDSTRQVEVAHLLVACYPHQLGQAFLIGKLLDRGRQVAIGAKGAGDSSADERQYTMKIELEELSKDGYYWLREFQNRRPSSRPEHAAQLGKSCRSVCQIAQPESTGYRVKAAVREGKIHSVSF